MAGLSYVIGKLTFEEAFTILSLILYKIQNYFVEIIGSPSMSPFVGTPTNPLFFFFSKIKWVPHINFVSIFGFLALVGGFLAFFLRPLNICPIHSLT